MSVPWKLLGRVLDGWRSPKTAIPPRCYIDGKPMRELRDDEPRLVLWRRADLPVFRCPDGHEFSPGNYAEGRNPAPDNTGDTRGEI